MYAIIMKQNQTKTTK